MQSLIWTGRHVSRALFGGICSCSSHSQHQQYPLSSSSPSAAATERPGPEARLVSAICGFPKSVKKRPAARNQIGDDAWFVGRHKALEVLGVADGVGGWRHYGIDPGVFSAFLMQTCERLVTSGACGTSDPAMLLARSFRELLENKQPILGSSTACLVMLNRETSTVHTANIGDSGFLVVRGGQVVHRSEEQTHYFNTPFQLALPPPEHSGRVLSDRPESADVSDFVVEDGDVILLATDGVFDNVPDSLLLAELIGLEGVRDESKIQGVANSIAWMARSLANDPNFLSPFAKSARHNGIDAMAKDKLFQSVGLGKMERVQIHFEGSENTFYSGQYVSGHVSVHLDVPTRLRAITLRISGTAEVKWEEWIHKRNPQKQLRRASQRSANGLPQQAPPSNEMKVFKSNELYFEYKIALLAASNHDPMFEAREYKFPFHFNLPQNIPSSFEGQFGHVRYVVCCKVDKPCARDHEAKTILTVICPLDLNRFPHLATMADASDVRKFWCLFHRSKPTTVIMRLSESGIVPEQLINPNIDVDNTSDVRINQVRLMLIMSCSYTAMGVKKVEKTVLVESHLGAVEPKKARSWFRGIFIQVPPVPPSGLNNCTLIDISYKLKLVAEPERPHLNITVSLPLTVGTIPFRNNFDPSTPLPSAPPSIEPLIGTRLLTEPPSYEESINSQGSPDYLEIQPSQGFLPPHYPSLPLPPEIIQDTVKEPPPA